jgi:Ca-activated chloride channel family protein
MFTFAWPYILLLLPLIWVVKKFFPGKQANQDTMLRVPFLSRLTTLNQSGSIVDGTKQIYAFSAWSLLLLACANPQWLGELLPVQQDGRNIMLAVDLSPSMAMPDLQRGNNLINRLQSVKTVAEDFIDKRQGDKLGLILFGSKAYIQTPLTFDRKTVRSMLDDATIGLAGDHTAIGDALGLAVKKFSTENLKSRVLILLTDGANNTGMIDPMEAAELARQNNIKIYTVGIGASRLEVSNIFGSQLINPSADLDETLLKNIANKTQGQYFRAEDQTALTTILDAINKLEPVSAENKTARPVTALFYWPLAAALFFFTLILFPNVKLRL